MDEQPEGGNSTPQDTGQPEQTDQLADDSSLGDWIALAIPFTLGLLIAVVPLVFFNFPLYVLPLVFCLQLFLRTQRLRDQLKRKVGYALTIIMLAIGLGMFFFLFKPVG